METPRDTPKDTPARLACLRALVEKAMRGLVRFKSREARELFFIRLAVLETLENKDSKTARHRRASEHFRQHGHPIDT